MIKIEHFEVLGWEHAIRGMRNPMNSLEKSDSVFDVIIDIDSATYVGRDLHNQRVEGKFDRPYGFYTHEVIGPNDLDLMLKLSEAGTDHAKFRRMITVYADLTAPLYWWKEFDTYKVGTVANSCSTMHKIHTKEFTLDDFSHEHLEGDGSMVAISIVIDVLNGARKMFLSTKDKKYWWQMIQLLPSSYNQKRTVMLNYEVLANIYKSRKDHKLDEWRELCKWIEELPYSEIITGEEK